jgi:hypothetical protein
MSLEYHYKPEDLTYRIEFVTKKNKNISNIFIEIYGKPFKEFLLDLTGNYHLPLLSKQIIQKKIMWGVTDNQWFQMKFVIIAIEWLKTWHSCRGQHDTIYYWGG